MLWGVCACICAILAVLAFSVYHTALLVLLVIPFKRTTNTCNKRFQAFKHFNLKRMILSSGIFFSFRRLSFWCSRYDWIHQSHPPPPSLPFYRARLCLCISEWVFVSISIVCPNDDCVILLAKLLFIIHRAVWVALCIFNVFNVDYVKSFVF